MIKVSVMYPYKAGARFDFEYYLEMHMPLVLERLGPACKRHSVDRGISSGRPESPPLYLAVCQLEFESLESFNVAFGPHAKEISADMPNYTDIVPLSQVSETLPERIA